MLPATAVRQAITLYADVPDNPRFLEPEYDVVERVLRFRQPAGAPLEPGLVYTVELIVPKEPGDEGLRAFDGAPLEEGPMPLQFHFRTARIEPGPPQPAARVSCLKALNAFSAGGCGNQASCHDADEPRMGLNLDSSGGLLATAISRVAHQTMIGPRSVSLEEPLRLGVQMPIVDPGRPDNSYLLYKLLVHPTTFGDDCESRHRVALGGQCVGAPEQELTRLREWFVRGHPMPLEPPTGTFGTEQVRTIADWIAGGAACP